VFMILLSDQAFSMNERTLKLSACELCYQRHKRCSNQRPCDSCVASNMTCTMRERKRRGRRPGNLQSQEQAFLKTTVFTLENLPTAEASPNVSLSTPSIKLAERYENCSPPPTSYDLSTSSL